MARTKRPKHFDYDLIVIGSGAGGGVAAHMAVSMGKKVAIIEHDKLGGECPNYGCVPTKALLRAAQVFNDFAEFGPQFGITATNPSLNMISLKKWKDLAVKRTGTSIGSRAFTDDGIAVIQGSAQFITPYEISTGDQRLTAKKFLIASGTHSFIPKIEGLEETGFITYKDAINLTKLPKSLFVIGGGAIGVEFSHLFNRLGVEVSQAEFTNSLLNKEEPEVSELLEALFQRREINVLTNTSVYKVTKDRQKKVVAYQKNGRNYEVRVDEVLVAAGKMPNVDLGLENAKVKYSSSGIKTNNMMQTSTKHIYAAGDVVGPYQFTHMASYQSRIAAHNMFKREKIVAHYHAVPRVIFSEPEIASVGLTEAEAKARRIKVRVNAVPTSIIGRANTSNQPTGFVKVVAAPSGVLLGGTVFAPRAGEMMQELAVAIQNGLKASDVAATIHAFPTWSEAVRIACAGIK